MARTYAATAVRDCPEWWMVEIPELGVYGQAATLEDAPAAAREIAALWLDVDPSEIDVTVTVKDEAAEGGHGGE